ncbi:MAG TPA: agmatine deiminase family protein [Gammaproteobacteria bacterium]|nr:agmatine deiminase family protein [Gammaproteobacteria bacterium]
MAVSRTGPTPAATAGVALRGEWRRHRRTWMAWPWHPETFVGTVAAAQEAYARVANTIGEFEPVAMVVRPGHQRKARRLLSAAVEILVWPIDDAWMRDIAPSFVVDGSGRMAGVDWEFNDYGNKDERGLEGYGNDAATAERILAHLGIKRRAAPLVCEGGTLVADGEGTLITTESVLLNRNRNPELGAEAIEAIFAEYLGVRRTIWIPEGLDHDDTDGHADNLVAFAAPGVVLALAEDDPGDLNYTVLADLRRRLAAARDARGRRLEILSLPQPRARYKRRMRQALSYVNFCLVNGGVLIPAYDDPRRDANARSIVAEAFPGRKAVSLPTLAIADGGGSLHCITHEEPDPCAS